MTVHVDEMEATEEPITRAVSDTKRRLDLVIQDHAREAWGQLRAIDALDSSKAEEILVTLMEKLLIEAPNAIRKDTMNRHAQLLDAGKKLKTALMKTWFDTGINAGQTAMKKCRVCGEAKHGHKIKCSVRVALAAAKVAGITAGD